MAPATAALLQRTHTSSNATFSGRQQEASSSGQHYSTAPAPRRTALRRSPLRPAVSVHRRQQPGLAWQRVCLARGKAFCGPGSLEKGREAAGVFSNSIMVPTTAMARLGGSAGGVTIERSKLDLSQKVQTVEPKLSNDGGGGGIGNKIFNGGGGDGDDGDDDDYFNFEDGDGDGDDGFWRTAVQELYDEASINAVLQEWFRTFADLPAIIRQSVQLGLFSSAQLVRFLCMDVRPNITRQVTRSLPPRVARGVVGRLMADPAFMQKLLIEELITVGLSIAYELQQRGDNFVRELDLVAVNTLALMGATGALVWLVAPSRSYGAVHKFPWQNMLHNLPNHVFDASTPYRRFSVGSRIASLFAKAGELCAVGSMAGAAQSLLGAGLVRLHQMKDPEFKPSLPVPELKRSSGGLAAYMSLVANLRYQIVSGVDRLLFDRSKVMLVYLALSSVLRTGSQVYGNSSRIFSQGMPLEAPVRAPKLLPKSAPKRAVKKKAKKQAPQHVDDDFEMSARMLRLQQLRRRRQQQQQQPAMA